MEDIENVCRPRRDLHLPITLQRRGDVYIVPTEQPRLQDRRGRMNMTTSVISPDSPSKRVQHDHTAGCIFSSDLFYSEGRYRCSYRSPALQDVAMRCLGDDVDRVPFRTAPSRRPLGVRAARARAAGTRTAFIKSRIFRFHRIRIRTGQGLHQRPGRSVAVMPSTM
jgi:hypothetical protein